MSASADGAVRLVLDVRRLAGDDRDVVVVRLVAGRVVILEQRPLRRERLGEVGVAGRFAEGRRVVLVLEHDHEHVAYLRLLVSAGTGSRIACAQPACQQERNVTDLHESSLSRARPFESADLVLVAGLVHGYFLTKPRS